MTRRAYLYFVLTFLLGVVVGSAGMFIFAWYGGHWHHRLDSEHIVHFLKHHLNLSERQVGQLKPIVEGWMSKQKELQDKVDPQFQALRQEFDDRVRQILNSEQLAKFNELARRYEERMRKLKSR